jgi:phosphatidylglycerophosphate synthase
VTALPNREGYLARWSALHGGYDPRGSRLISGYLRLMYVLARPFAVARVPPDVLTLGGLLISALLVLVAAQEGRWLILAAVIAVLSGVADNIDGAVAVLTDRATRFGYVLDSVVDRVSDALYLVALWVVGAPAAVCVVGGALMLLQEYLRARAGNAGMGEIGVITVWERPTRVVVTAMFLLAGGLFPAYAVEAATAGAAAWVGLGIVGFIQLLVVVRRLLR